MLQITNVIKMLNGNAFNGFLTSSPVVAIASNPLLSMKSL